MKILLIIEDAKLREKLERAWKKERFVVEVVNSFKAAYVKLNNYEYDSLVVDWDVKDGDETRLVHLTNRESPQTGIVIISKRTDVASKILGLNAGADDYLSKPFVVAELSARLKAIIRRKFSDNRQVIRVGSLEIQPGTRSVSFKGQAISLTNKEYNILFFLIRNKNRIVPKEAIAEHLWGDYMENKDHFDFLYTHIKNLRKKLAAHGAGHYVSSVYGIGYRLIP